MRTTSCEGNDYLGMAFVKSCLVCSVNKVISCVAEARSCWGLASGGSKILLRPRVWRKQILLRPSVCWKLGPIEASCVAEARSY